MKSQKLDVNRAEGLLLGLCAGDKNGGPQRLALLCLDSVCKNQNQFNVDNVWSNYCAWMKNGAYDTGPTMINVYRATIRSKQKPNAISKATYDVAIKNKQFAPAGIGTAHRNAVLSMIPTLQSPFEMENDLNENSSKKNEQNNNDNNTGMGSIDENEENKENKENKENENVKKIDLISAIIGETELTHYSPMAKAVSIAVGLICRALILGNSLNESLILTINVLKGIKNDSDCQFTNEIAQLLQCYVMQSKDNNDKNDKNNKDNNNKMEWGLDDGGYAPNVLYTALHFLTKYNNFEEAMSQSLKFAGPCNYCPVLVGSIGGAMYGKEIILKSKHLKHKHSIRLVNNEGLSKCLDKNLFKQNDTLLDVMIRVSSNVAALWSLA